MRLLVIGVGDIDGDVNNGGYYAGDVNNGGYYAGGVVDVVHLGLLQGRLLGLKEQWAEHR